jgi:hypothetical protein
MAFYGSRLTHCKNGHEFSLENTRLCYHKEGVRRVCRACNIENGKNWRIGKTDKRDPMYVWARNLRNTYNITPTQWQIMYDLQVGVCAICENPEISSRLHVDHNHSCCAGSKSCGKCIRGLVCSSCNNGLGRFKDNPALLRNAANYLERY